MDETKLGKFGKYKELFEMFRELMKNDPSDRVAVEIERERKLGRQDEKLEGISETAIQSENFTIVPYLFYIAPSGEYKVNLIKRVAPDTVKPQEDGSIESTIRVSGDEGYEVSIPKSLFERAKRVYLSRKTYTEPYKGDIEENTEIIKYCNLRQQVTHLEERLKQEIGLTGPNSIITKAIRKEMLDMRGKLKKQYDDHKAEIDKWLALCRGSDAALLHDWIPKKV